MYKKWTYKNEIIKNERIKNGCIKNELIKKELILTGVCDLLTVETYRGTASKYSIETMGWPQGSDGPRPYNHILQKI